MRRLFLLALATTAVGCVLKQSPPVRLYVLDAVADAGAPGPAQAVLGVQRVTVPSWIDRPEMTNRTAGGEIVIDDFARWGEPFSRGVQRVIAENLARLLADRHVVSAPYAPRQALDFRLEIAITEAARQADGTVLVEARWGISDAGGASLVQRRSSHRTAPAAEGAATVRALSEALSALSGEIAEAVRALPAPPRS